MIFRILLAAALFLAGPVQAFILQTPTPVVEFYNVYLGHYFMTGDFGEIAEVEAGKAGPGWVRTGFAFLACPTQALCSDSQATVRRFYGTPGLGPNSHFYTADDAEASGLDRPGTGWTLEKVAFYTVVPDAAGKCGAGMVPVYRLYNNRWMFNDSNHRYVTNQAERARMVAKGWADEGARFCASGVSEAAVKTFDLDRQLEGNIRPSAQCEDESVNRGPCFAVNNLPVPSQPIAGRAIGNSGEPFFGRTAFPSFLVYAPDASRGAAAVEDPFVAGSSMTALGIHVDTRSRGANSLSSLNPLYQFPTTATPAPFDERVFPFAAQYESEVQLCVSFTLFVKTLQVRSAGGAAYGHPTLEFIDQRSGKHLYYTALAYGTVPTEGVFIAIDSGTGRPIVGSALGTNAGYMRTLGLPALPIPATGWTPPHSWGWGGDFEYRMDRVEFKRVIDSARTLVPELSTDPADYFLRNFHFNNEVAGDGEIGLTLRDFQVRLLRR